MIFYKCDCKIKQNAVYDVYIENEGMKRKNSVICTYILSAGCPDWTIPRSIGLVMTAESKAASIKSGEPPFAYGDKITFKCIS